MAAMKKKSTGMNTTVPKGSAMSRLSYGKTRNALNRFVDGTSVGGAYRTRGVSSRASSVSAAKKMDAAKRASGARKSAAKKRAY